MHRFLILAFICLSFKAYSQKQYVYDLGITTGINRMDFFTGLQGTWTKQRWQYNVQLEIGMNRTFFQQRIFPRISGGIGFSFIQRDWFQMVAQLNYAYSFLKIYALSKHYNHWNELYGGIKFVLGKKIKFFALVSSGWMNELYYNDLKNKYTGLHSLGYYGQIGLSYAW